MIAALRRLPRVETAVLLVAFALLVGVAVVRQRDRPVVAPLDSYSSYDARSGGYRALFELLSREDGGVERFERRPAFLSDDRDGRIATLVYAEPLPYDPRQLANTAADVAALEAWVRAGNRLVYLGRDDEAAKHGDLGLPATQAARGRGTPRVPLHPYVAPALIADGIASVASTAVPRYRFPRHGATVLLADARGILALRYPYGRGEVVAVVDETLFTNAGLATADRARFAAALVPAPRDGAVAFDESAHGYVTPEHWWQIVPRGFAIALGIGALAAAIALAGAAMRLGPAIVPEPRDDRGTGDFVEAVGSLLQRARDPGRAVRDAFAEISRIAARSLAMPEDAETGAIAARIEPASARTQYVRLGELAASAPRTEADFVRAIALAQHLRLELTGHARARR